MGNYEYPTNIHEEYSELVKRAKSGDESAFAEIYQKSERYVYTTCYEVLGNKEDAEDAMQETYMELYNDIGELKEGRAFVDWIHTTAYYKASNLRRKKKPDLAYEDAIANDEIPEAADDDLDSLPESLVTNRESRSIIKNIIHDQLSDVQYDTVLLHYYNDLPVAKIAEIMDCPEGTIKTRLKACRAKIKAGIEAYEKQHGGTLVGAAGVPFLTLFFMECSKDLTLPVIDLFPLKVPVNPSATSGANIGELSETGDPMNGMAQSASKAGNLGKETSKAGRLAKNAGSSANMGSKAGVFASPLAKIGIAVAAVAVVAVPTVIVVSNINKKKDDKVYEVKYDGLYCNIDEDEGTNEIYRFYPNGDLIYTSYDFDDEDDCFPTGSWFTLDSDDDRVEHGTYEEDEGKIEITVEHGSEEKEYEGEINKNDITIGKDEKFKYYEFDEIDGYEPEVTAPSASQPIESDPTDPTETTEDPVESKVKGAYLKVIVQYENEIKAHENYPQDILAHNDLIPSINYIDLNKDGINEMIFVCFDDSTKEGIAHIYTYDPDTDTAVLMWEPDISAPNGSYKANGGDGSHWSEMVYLDNDHILSCFHNYVSYNDSYNEGMNEYKQDPDIYYHNINMWWAFWDNADYVSISYANDKMNAMSNKSTDEYYAALNEYLSHEAVPIYPGEARFKNADFSLDMDYLCSGCTDYKMTDTFSAFDSVYAKGNYFLYDDFIAFLGGTASNNTAPVQTSFSGEWKKPYLDLINSITYEDMGDSSRSFDSGDFTFDLVYINDDDIPELLVCLTRYESYARYSGDVVYANLYTFKDGEIIELEHCMSVVTNTVTTYYERDNMIITSGYDHAGGLVYVTVHSIGKTGDAMETTSYQESRVDLELYPDYWSGDSTVTDNTWYYFISDSVTHELTKITKAEFEQATTGKGARNDLVAEKTLDEITKVLS